jgi:hypothetical protein
MNHWKFNVATTAFIIIITLTVALYDYAVSLDDENYLTLIMILKPLPNIAMIMLVGVYYIIYKINTYALLIQIFLIFSLVGDILLMFYIPEIKMYNHPINIILGGGSFIIGRIFLLTAMIVYPLKHDKEFYFAPSNNYTDLNSPPPYNPSYNPSSYNPSYNPSSNNGLYDRINDGNHPKYIKPNFTDILFSGMISLIYVIASCLFYIYNLNASIMSFLLSIYIIMIGINLQTSMLRLKLFSGFEIETTSSQVKGFIGTLLYTISDSILFHSLFISPDKILEIVSISIYWFALFILTISIVRTNKLETEIK